MSGARAVIFGCSGPELDAREAALFREADPWGFILFARNVQDPDQLLRLTTALRNCVSRDAPILVDQEGGRVARLKAPHWLEWPTLPEEIARAENETSLCEALRLRYRLIASELQAVGIDVNCAPMLDVVRAGTHGIIADRALGPDPETVLCRGSAIAAGLISGGVLPVLKHMPGHGAATTDSHHEMPVVTLARGTLDAVDFAPFRGLSDMPLGMTAHVKYPVLDKDVPATLSADIISMIRTEIGFDGALMTDDIGMSALDGPIAERGAAALSAGCDLVLHCNGDVDEMATMAMACPLLEGARLARTERAEIVRGKPDGEAADEILDRYTQLTRSALHA